MGHELIIAVNETEPISRRVVNACIPGSAQASVGPVYDTYLGVGRGKVVTHSGTGVSGTVIDKDYLHAGDVL